MELVQSVQAHKQTGSQILLAFGSSMNIEVQSAHPHK